MCAMAVTVYCNIIIIYFFLSGKSLQDGNTKMAIGEVETLQEELQTKNQQVKQYQRQVDAVKAELDRCRADLKRLQEQVCAIT